MSKAPRWSQEQLDAHVGKAVKVKAAPKPRMNLTEASYGSILEAMKRKGEIRDYGFERLRLRLADNTWYWPDFDVICLDGSVQIHEVKGGFIREDSWLKIKIAADLYPHWSFWLCQRKRKSEPWTVKQVGR